MLDGRSGDVLIRLINSDAQINDSWTTLHQRV